MRSSFSSWTRSGASRSSSHSKRSRSSGIRLRNGYASRLRVEPLEDRRLLAVFTVTTQLDGGPGSLRQAVIDANASPGDDEIVLENSRYLITIAGRNEDAGLTGDLDVTDTTGSLTVRGNSAILQKGSGDQPVDRFWHVHPGAQLTLSDLQIFDGNAGDDRGGAILVEGDGTALPNNAPNLKTQDVKIFYSEARLGGGIYVSGAMAEIVDSTISHANASQDGGGVYVASGVLEIADSGIGFNTASRNGGGIYLDSGELSIVHSSLFQNDADGNGGGIAQRDGILRIAESSLNYSSSFHGAGIDMSGGQSTISNTTISGNHARGQGGGIRVGGGAGLMTILNSTIADNNADRDGQQTNAGGGIWNDGQLLLHNSIVAENQSGPFESAVASDLASRSVAVGSSNNLIGVGDETGLVDGVDGNLIGSLAAPLDPRLGLLKNDGETGNSHALLEGSPAIDAGKDLSADGILTDQRGMPRPQGAAYDIGAFEVPAPIVVNSFDDVLDGDPNNGVTTLREAVLLANATQESNEIILPAGVFTLALDGPNEDNGLTGDLDVHYNGGPLHIQGAGANTTIIDAAGLDRIFHGHPQSRLSLSDLTLRGGNVVDPTFFDGRGGAVLTEGLEFNASRVVIESNQALAGGGVYLSRVGGGNPLLTSVISDSVIRDNSALGFGGGIRQGDGLLVLESSAVLGNTADRGGGLGMDDTEVETLIRNSTISGNRSQREGGGIFLNEYGGDVTILASTITNNQAGLAGGTELQGGGIRNRDDNFGNALIQGSIVAGNFSGPLDAPIPNDFAKGDNNPNNSHNLFGIAYSPGVVDGLNGNRAGTAAAPLDPRLGPLGDYGGPTPTHLLLPDSPAVDAGLDLSGEGILTDQRGVARPQGTAYDIGSFEVSGIVVNSLGDADDGDPGNGATTLREALRIAALELDTNVISFDLPLGPQTIELSGTELRIDSNVHIAGPGWEQLTIDALEQSRVIHVMPGVTAEIAGLTITGGDAPEGVSFDRGGGILNDHASLTIESIRLINNMAARGGGLLSDGENGAASTIIRGSTIADNHATSIGGGLYNFGRNGEATMVIESSSITTNDALDSGGGLFNWGTDGNAQVTVRLTTFSGNLAREYAGGLGTQNGIINVFASTIVRNVANSDGIGNEYGGGIFSVFAMSDVRMNGSIVAENIGDDLATADGGQLTSLGHNLIGVIRSGLVTQESDIIGVDPLLAPLADNGGPTLTHALLPGSPAIDAGTDLSGEGILTDQRGVARPQQGTYDIGSFERIAPQIANRFLFYNHSFWDGDDPGTGKTDDAAIATDKSALLPGQSATFANVSGFVFGINGIIVDLASDEPLTLDDYQFRIGNGNDLGIWTEPAVEPTLVVRPGEGSSGTDRYTLIWPDNEIKNTWLQVMILPSERTGLAGPDVFYFASVAGDTGQGGGPFGFADAADQLAIRQNPTLGFNIATLDNPLDINRNGKVDANDRLIIRQSPVIGFRRVQPITAPGGGGSGGAASTSSATSSASLSQAVEAVFAQSAAHRRLLPEPALRRAALEQRPISVRLSPASVGDDAEPNTWRTTRPLGRRTKLDRGAVQRVFEQLVSADSQ